MIKVKTIKQVIFTEKLSKTIFYKTIEVIKLINLSELCNVILINIKDINLQAENYFFYYKFNHIIKKVFFYFFIKCMQSMTMTLSRRCFFSFFFFIKCMQSMTMTLSRRCMYAKLHVTWSKSLLYIFSLINHIDSLRIQALSLKLSQSYFRFSSFLRTLRILLFHF